MNIGHTNVLHYMNINLHTCTFSVSTQLLKDQQTFISLHFPLQNSDDENYKQQQQVFFSTCTFTSLCLHKHNHINTYSSSSKKNTMVNYDGYEYIIQIYSNDLSNFLDDYTECLLLKQSTGIKIRRYSESVKML